MNHQQDIRQWAAELLAQKPLILDTETTGLGLRAEPIQIAIINHQGQTLFDQLIKPAVALIEPGAQAVHGITAEHVADAHPLGKYNRQLKEIIIGKTIAIYNAPYDTRILDTACDANGIAKLTSWANWEDVMEPYAQFWGDYSNYRGSYTWQKLTNACRQQGIPIIAAHNALGDCHMTLALITKLATGE